MKLEQLHEDYAGQRLPKDLEELAEQFMELFDGEADHARFYSAKKETINVYKPLPDEKQDASKCKRVAVYHLNFVSEKRAEQFKSLLEKKLPQYVVKFFKDDKAVLEIFKMPTGWDKQLLSKYF